MEIGSLEMASLLSQRLGMNTTSDAKSLRNILIELREMMIALLAQGHQIRIKSLGVLVPKYQAPRQITNKLSSGDGSPSHYIVSERIQVTFRQREGGATQLLAMSPAYFDGVEQDELVNKMGTQDGNAIEV